MSEQTEVGELEGRELDVAVAEEVMGFDARSDVWRPGGKVWVDDHGVGRPIRGKRALPYFSSDIADAWSVVEHVMENLPVIGFDVIRSWQGVRATIEPHPCRWREEVVLRDHPLNGLCDPREVGEDWTRTTATAICRAALRAFRKAEE